LQDEFEKWKWKCVKCIFKYTLRSFGRLDFAKYGCSTWRVDYKSNKLFPFFDERGELQYPKKNLSEHRREPTSSTHILC